MEMTVKNFKDALMDDRLMGSSCEICGRISIPPRPICPECRSDELAWVELSGKGKLVALTEVRVPLSRFIDDCPYTVGIVKLAEGPMISGLVKKGEVDPHIGDNVKAFNIKKGEEALLGFRPV